MSCSNLFSVIFSFIIFQLADYDNNDNSVVWEIETLWKIEILFYICCCGWQKWVGSHKLRSSKFSPSSSLWPIKVYVVAGYIISTVVRIEFQVLKINIIIIVRHHQQVVELFSG